MFAQTHRQVRTAIIAAIVQSVATSVVKQCGQGRYRKANETVCACHVSGCVVALRYGIIDDTPSVPEVYS